MKAESLFHLLQIRARKLEDGADDATRRKLQALQAALRVTHSRGWFEITWHFEGRDLSLSVPERDFAFYVAGDTAKAVEQRGHTGNVRQDNWRAAAALWQRLADVSGFTLAPPPAAGEAMGLTPAQVAPGMPRKRQMAASLAVVLAGTAATLFQGTGPAFAGGLVAVLLLLLLPGLEETHLRRRFSVIEIALTGGAAFLPAWTGGNALWLVPVLAGLNGALWLERLEIRLAGGWFLGGIAVGAVALILGWAALLPAAPLAVALVLLHLLAPRRIARAEAAAMATGLALGFVAGIAAAAMPSVDPDPSLAAALIGVALLACFTLWPFHGLLFRLLPWLSIGTLGLSALGAVIAPPGPAEGAAALAGLTLVVLARAARALFASEAPGPSRRKDRSA